MLPVRVALPALLVALLVPSLAAAAPPIAAPLAPAADVLLGAAPHALSPASLLALRSAGAPDGLDVEVLLDDTRTQFDDAGKRSTEYHMIYRVLTDHAVQSWATVAASYAPWYQQKPVIQARVVTPDGAAHALDPKTLTDALAGEQGQNNMYGDRHNLSAPLPAVRVGCVVEWTIRIAEHRPFFAAGTLDRTLVYSNTYSGLVRVSVSAPDKLGLTHSVRGSRQKPVIERKDGRVTVTLLERDVRPYRKWPAASDPAMPVLPMLEFSTARSWSEVAKAYASAVDTELARFDAKSLAQQVLGGESDPKQKLQKLLAHVHREVRYTGLELGERSILPASPADTLARRYGDCKDKATLLVGLLRAAGFEAHVALLRAGPGIDVPSNLPGMGLFDHAIVRVGGKENLWIDATADHASPYELPYGDQDRLALVASPKTRTLERTPRTKAADSLSVEDVYVTFPELGKASLKEVTTGRGPLEAELRGVFDRSDDQLKEHFHKYVRERYDATVVRAHAEAAQDPERSFELSIEASDSKTFQTYDEGGNVPLVPNALFAQLPGVLYETPRDRRSQEEIARDTPDARYQEPPLLPIYVPRAHTVRVNYHLSVVDGFAFQTLPDPLEMEVEGIQLSRKVSKEGPRAVTISYEVRTDTQKVLIKSLDQVRTVLDDFADQAPANVRFVNEAHDLLEHDDLAGCLKRHRELLAKYPNSVAVRSRYARDLSKAGLGVAARRAAEELAKDHPESARAHWTLGFVYLFDEVGRDSFPGADFVRAEQALRRALERDPDDPTYHAALATVLTSIALEKRPNDRKRLEEAAGLYEKLRTRFEVHDSDFELLRNYVWRDKHVEAVRLAEELEASEDRNALWLVSIAVRDGAAAAQRKAEQIAGRDARAALSKAGSMLALMGRYALAAELYKLPGVREQNASIGQAITSGNGQAGCLAKLAAPARTVVEWYRTYLSDPTRRAHVQDEFEKLPQGRIDTESLRKQLVGTEREVAGLGRTAAALTLPLVADTMACSFRWEAEEKSGAVRVKAHDAGASRGADPPTYYLRKQKDGYVLLGVRAEGRTVAFSRAMLTALEEKKLDEARQWAGWAWEEVEPFGGHRERYGFADGARALWPKDVKSASEAELGLLGAYLAAWHGVKDREQKRLEADQKRLASDPEKSRAIALALSYHYDTPDTAKRGSQLLAELHRAFPEDKDLWRRYLQALYAAYDDATLTSELQAYDVKEPHNEVTSHLRNRMDRRAGRYGEVFKRTEHRLAKNWANKGELNNAAWEALFVEADLARATKLAEAACEPEGEASPNALHTLATLYAEHGDIGQARAKLVLAMHARGERDVAGHEWYTWGRIAERAGMTDIARDAYQRVERPEDTTETSTYELAQRRLKALAR